MEIYHKAARRLVKVIDSKIKEGKKTLILLSSGSSVNLYGKLAKYLCRVKPPLFFIAQIDERFKPEGKEDINAEVIKKAGFQIHYYIVSQEGSVATSAEEYNQTIGKLWRESDYKIAVLGIGEDCHTAGLIPGYEKDWNKDRLVVGYNLAADQKFRARITITPKLLLKLNYALVVAVGEKKNEAIKNAFKKENLQNLNVYPAAIIQKIKKVELFTDIRL